MENNEIKAREEKASQQLTKYGFILHGDNTINLEHMTKEINGKEFYIDVTLSSDERMTLEDVESVISAFADGKLTFSDIAEELTELNEQDREDAADN